MGLSAGDTGVVARQARLVAILAVHYFGSFWRGTRDPRSSIVRGNGDEKDPAVQVEYQKKFKENVMMGRQLDTGVQNKPLGQVHRLQEV